MILKLMQQVRCYARFSGNSSKVLEDVTVAVSNQIGINKKRTVERERPKPDKSYEKEGVQIKHSESEEHVDFPLYSKVQELDANLKKTMTTIKSRKNREKSDRVLLEGKRLIRDAVESGAIPETILFSRVDDMKSLSLPKNGVNVYKLPYKTISLWSDMVTCPGIMAIFRTPKVHEKQASSDALPLTIVCDNVREPGNLGAILRVAAGVGCEKIILTKGCVDLWEPKVLRSGAGAHFRLPIHKNVSLPSLDTMIDAQATVFLADNNTLLETGEYREKTGPFTRLIPLIPYDAVDFTVPSSMVVVIGGETEGLSDEVMRLASHRNGARIHIPLNNDVESLNTGIALGVILFEIKRQLLCASSSNSVHVDRIPLLNTL